jgi:hypothetical protein
LCSNVPLFQKLLIIKSQSISTKRGKRKKEDKSWNEKAEPHFQELNSKIKIQSLKLPLETETKKIELFKRIESTEKSEKPETLNQMKTSKSD